MQRVVLSILMGVGLSGCAGSSELKQLNQRVSSLESSVQALEQMVKGRRAVRLPTGAPLTVESRQVSRTGNSEQSSYDNALQLFQSGDMNGAIRAFGQFNRQYPNATQRPDALFYLAQANYSQRNYVAAQQALESLVYQSPSQQVSPKAVTLLERIYQTTGQTAKVQELSGFLQRGVSSAPVTNSNGMPIF